MKRQPLRKGTEILCTFLTVSCLFLCSLFTSCGMEHFYLIEPPEALTQPAESVDSHICVFQTKDAANAVYTDLNMYGTFLYYRIYGSLTTMISEKDYILSVNAEYSENGYNRMKSYGYQEMTPKIPFGSSNKTVTVRLVSELSYNAGVSYTESGVSGEISLAAPRRSGSSASFTFTSAYKPDSDAIDVKGVSSDTTCWYVPLFAVSYGEGTDSVQHYSQIEYLGYFTIEL